MSDVNNNHSVSSKEDEVVIIPNDHTLPYKNEEKIVYPTMYEEHFDSLLIPYDMIHKRTKQLAHTIAKNYNYSITSPSSSNGNNSGNNNQEPLVIVCILKGSTPFYSLLTSELSLLSIPYIIEFIRVKSYEGNLSSGKVNMENSMIPKSINGRHVVIVEDIVDTGRTLQNLLPKLVHNDNNLVPKSVEVCTLLTKRLDSDNDSNNNSSSNADNNQHHQQQKSVEGKVIPTFVGFSIPDKFVVGFGLDFNEMYRDLRDIWVLGSKGIEMGGYADC